MSIPLAEQEVATLRQSFAVHSVEATRSRGALAVLPDREGEHDGTDQREHP